MVLLFPGPILKLEANSGKSLSAWTHTGARVPGLIQVVVGEPVTPKQERHWLGTWELPKALKR